MFAKEISFSSCITSALWETVFLITFDMFWESVVVIVHIIVIFQDIVIQEEDEIRLKIVGTRVDAKDIVSLFFHKTLSFTCCK